MKNRDKVEAMRNPEYRRTLPAEQQAGLPEVNIGSAELSDEVLRSVSGGCAPKTTYLTSCPHPQYGCA